MDLKRDYAQKRLGQASEARRWAESELRSAVVDAYKIGVPKTLIHKISGVSRTAINKWLAEDQAGPVA